MNNSRLFRLSRIVIAFTAASGMMINTAYATDEAKAATQYTQQVNQNYAKSLPFSDRQDFDDAQRGFIAPLLDEGILRDANGKIYYRANDYKFDINAAAPETVNPSLWRQSQINGISGLFKVLPQKPHLTFTSSIARKNPLLPLSIPTATPTTMAA